MDRIDCGRDGRRRQRAGWSGWLGLALLALPLGGGEAAELRLLVVGVEAGLEQSGLAQPLENAVVSLHPVSGAQPLTRSTAEIDQRDSMFVPTVLPLQAGTRVTFPNSDNTLHHVYSFSPAKRFELPLYSGQRADPVLFDKLGVVTLGCNIHDWMVAHVVVLDTPYFASTGEDGIARVQAPPGDYALRVWHVRQSDATAQPLTLPQAGLRRELKLELAAATPAPQQGSSRLRELQQRLRQLRKRP